MDATNTSRATTSANSSEGKSRALPAGTKDQSLFWKDVKQAALFVGGFVFVGFLAVLVFAQLQGVLG